MEKMPPCYPLQGEVEEDLIQAFIETKQRISKQLPKLSKFVGGDTDFMMDVRYLCYYPEKIFELPTRLTIYESKFKNIDGTRGIVGGPHHVFTEREKRFCGSPENISIATIQPTQNGISSKLRHLPSEH